MAVVWREAAAQHGAHACARALRTLSCCMRRILPTAGGSAMAPTLEAQMEGECVWRPSAPQACAERGS